MLDALPHTLVAVSKTTASPFLFLLPREFKIAYTRLGDIPDRWNPYRDRGDGAYNLSLAVGRVTSHFRKCNTPRRPSRSKITAS